MTFVTQVTLGGAALTPEVVDETHLRVTTEGHAPGVVTAILIDQFDQATIISGAFEFIAAPAVQSIDPPTGTFRGGTMATLTGANFRADVTVFVDGEIVGPVQVIDAARMSFPMPPHDLGDVDILVRDIWGREAGLTQAYEYTEGSLEELTDSNLPANTATTFFGGTTLALGDLDGDDDLDAVFGRNDAPDVGDRLVTIVNNGQGKFTEGDGLPATGTPGDKLNTDGVALADLDGDGDLDIVATTTKKFIGPNVRYSAGGTTYMLYSPPYLSTRVFLNDGEGNFTLAKSAFDDPKKNQEVDLLLGQSVILGDIDDDNDIDICITLPRGPAISSYTSKVTNPPICPVINCRTVYNTFTVDYPADRPATRIFLNDGNDPPSFVDATADGIPAVADGDMFAAFSGVLGDLDGDGLLDLALTGDHDELRDSDAPEYVDGSKTRILLNVGGGVFENETEAFGLTAKDGDDRGGVAIAVGHINDDSFLDLVVSTPRLLTSQGANLPSTRVFLGGEDGLTEKTDALPEVAEDAEGETWRAIGLLLGSADNSGTLDIFLTDSSPIMAGGEQVSSTRLLRNDGDAGFTDLTAKTLGTSASGDYRLGHVLGLGDIDGDEDLDLFLSTILDAFVGEGKRPTRLFEFR
jgi:hypothetical protein